MKEDTMKHTMKLGLECYPNSNAMRDIFFRRNYISRKPLYDYYCSHLSDIGGGDSGFRMWEYAV